MFIKIVFILSIFYSLFSCAVSYYDNESYKNFTYIKPQVSLFLNTFTNKVIEEDKQSINLKLLQIKEYEKGKPNNEETVKQIEILYTLYTNYIVTNYWRVPELNIRKKIIESGFDVIIRTEQGKVHK